MPNAKLFKAQTVEQAIEMALKNLNVERSQIEVKVITEPKRGLFGKRQIAEIEVFVKKDEEMPTHVPLEDLDGKVWVKNGQIMYHPPKPGGRQPTLTFDELVSVSYNGADRKFSVELDNGVESLEIQLPPVQKPHRTIEIDVSPDKLEACLRLNLAHGIKYGLRDREPGRVVDLVLDLEQTPARHFTLQEISNELDKAGITYGIDFSQITEETLSTPNQSLLIAKGKIPKQPQNGYIKYLFQGRESNLDMEADKVDFYEMKPVLSVEVDEMLAQRIGGVEGENGVNVYGEAIHVAKPKEPHINAGEGVRLSDDQKIAYASKPGLPVIHNGLLKIVEVYELRSDANLETGNIRFNGEIIIHGNVYEKVKVQSHIGGIQIYGLVDRAVIEAEQDIFISRNAIASRLIAGGNKAEYIKLASFLQNLLDSLNQLVAAFNVVVSRQPNTGHGVLLKNIIELRFNHLPKNIKEFETLFAEINKTFEPDFRTLILQLKTLFLGRGPLKIDNISVVEQVINQLAYWVSIYRNSGEEINSITAAYLHNCTAEASGIVKITGQGAYYSKIVAGKGYFQNTGVFRGGSIIVNEGDILLKELGGPTGIVTQAAIVATGNMTIGTVYPNVTVSIKNEKYNFLNQAPNVRVLWTNQGLAVYSGSSKLL